MFQCYICQCYWGPGKLAVLAVAALHCDHYGQVPLYVHNIMIFISIQPLQLSHYDCTKCAALVPSLSSGTAGMQKLNLKGG